LRQNRKFSVQYTLSTALLRGFVNIDTFTDEAVNAPDIGKMLGKVSVQMVPEIPARFDIMHVEAEVESTDGSVVQTRCDGPRGMWGQPAISDDEHLVKIRDCLSKRLPADRMERCIALAHTVDTLDTASVSGVVDDCEFARVGVTTRTVRSCTTRNRLKPGRRTKQESRDEPGYPLPRSTSARTQWAVPHKR
jgi:2-methylcitrate dehydratase PrpD